MGNSAQDLFYHQQVICVITFMAVFLQSYRNVVFAVIELKASISILNTNSSEAGLISFW